MNYDKYIGYKVKLYTTEEQRQELERYFNISNFIYNLGIELQSLHYEKYKDGKEKYSLLSEFSLQIEIFKVIYKREDLQWLKEQ